MDTNLAAQRREALAQIEARMTELRVADMLTPMHLIEYNMLYASRIVARDAEGGDHG